MHETLFTYIKNHSSTPLAEADIKAIKESFVPRKLRKRQYLVQEAEVCKYVAFIVKGAMRQYTVDDKGVEHIVRLFIDNMWVTDRESFTKLTPSIYNIDAWEDCDLLLITKTDLEKRLTPIPAISETIIKISENLAIATQKRFYTISLSAEERYAQLVITDPEFLQRFPLHIIASYLGITRETLSRIRRQAVKR